MNNKYDEIDNLLFNYFQNNQTVPNIITTSIESALVDKKRKYKMISYFKKIIITIMSLLTLTGGIVFAKDIKIWVDNLVENIFGNYNNGVNTAIENGYMQDIDMEYIESNNISVKIEQLSLDDYNLGIVFNIKVSSNIDLNDISLIKFKNILITDEDNKVLFAEYESDEKFLEYCKKNKLDNNNFFAGYANAPANGSILNKENNTIVYSFYTTSNKFPISKKLSIKFDTIEFTKSTKYDEKLDTFIKDYFSIEGNWNMNIDLGKIQKYRRSIEYKVVNINDNRTTVTKAILSMSNMKLELITNSNKIDFNKLQNRKQANVTDMIPFHEQYIETANGKRFYQSNSGNNGYDTLESRKIRYYTTFDYTYFDKSDKIKIVLPTNKKRDLIIELEANDKAQ